MSEWYGAPLILQAPVTQVLGPVAYQAKCACGRRAISTVQSTVEDHVVLRPPHPTHTLQVPAGPRHTEPPHGWHD